MTTIDELNRQLETYLEAGWCVDTVDGVSYKFMIIHPKGEVYNDHDLVMNHCSYCDEDDPDWTEAWCDHSPELMQKEAEARKVAELVRKIDHYRFVESLKM